MNTNVISFAIEAHQKTNHLYDGKPYSIHLIMVALYAQKYSEILPNSFDLILNACWLHDVIEDCRVTYNDVKKLAGENVAEIVYAVTNEKGRNRKERANSAYYKGIRENKYAIYVKLCDRLANVKYSKDTNSSMLLTYKKENTTFLYSLFPDGYLEFEPMVNELINMLIE